jgi:hypothetical protein
MAKKKHLIETSAVPVALGESTPAHCAAFREAVVGGTQDTSTYIRKEFLRRWICYYIRMAFEVDHCGSLEHALQRLNQTFSIREAKTAIHAITLLLREKGPITNRRIVAKELARLAIAELRRFDRTFRSKTSNASGCRIGGKALTVDFNHLFDDLRAFMDSVGIVKDCPVNAFLAFGSEGKASRLVTNDLVATKTKAGQNLAKLQAKNRWVTCRECRTIGDAIIALEQPEGWCLVHIDAAFTILCEALHREHKPIPSLTAVDPHAPV